MRTKFKPTLLLYVSLVLASVAIVDANSFDAHRRDHRLIKKRAAPNEFARDLLGLGGSSSTSVDSASASSSSSASATSAAASSSPSSSAATSASQSSTGTASASSTTGSAGLLGSLVDGLLPTVSSSTSTTATSTSATTTSTTSSAPHTTEAPHTSATPVQITSTSGGYVVTITSDPSAASPTNTDTSSGSAATITHATWISILAVAGGIIGAAVIWTIFRKWKFRKSREFDDRMAPIDWQPTDDAGPSLSGSGLPGSSRRYSNASSFHSGSANEESLHGHGGYASAQQPLPDHDFTAGAGHLAPIGGYADLARGPSPQPQMHELHRALSLARPMPTASPAPSYQPHYDQYGMPVHHGGY